MNCYCCSGQTFEDCCQRLINGTAKPPAAEALMRSRYTAYAIVDVEYLLRTTHSSTRRSHDPQSLKQWAESCLWEKLEIISTVRGSRKDKRGAVEFKAFYRDSEHQLHVHHEYSNFVQELGKWFFVDGKVV